MRANGITGPIRWADAWDLAGILEATGRTVPRNKWVEEIRAAEGLASLEGLF